MEQFIAQSLLALLVASAGASGVMRYAARSTGPFVAMVLTLLGSAALCYVISTTKTPGFLAGIVGYLAGWLLGILGVAMFVGALGRVLYEALFRRPDQPRKPPRPFDLIGFCGLAALCVVLSLME